MPEPCSRQTNNITGGEITEIEKLISKMNTYSDELFSFNGVETMAGKRRYEERPINNGATLVFFASDKSKLPVEDQIRRFETFCEGKHFNIAARFVDVGTQDYSVLKEAIGYTILIPRIFIFCEEDCLGGFENSQIVFDAFWRHGNGMVILGPDLKTRCLDNYSSSKRGADRTAYNKELAQKRKAVYDGTRAVILATTPCDGVSPFSVDDQIRLMDDFCTLRMVDVVDVVSEVGTSDLPLAERRGLHIAIGSAILNRADYLQVLTPSFLVRNLDDYGSLDTSLNWLRIKARSCNLADIDDIMSQNVRGPIQYEIENERLLRRLRSLKGPDQDGDPDE